MKVFKNKTLRALVVFMLVVCLCLPTTVSVFASDTATTADGVQSTVVSTTETTEDTWVDENGNVTNDGNYDYTTDVSYYTEIYNDSVIIDEYAEGETYTMNIYVNSTQAFASFQLDFYMPGFTYIESVSKGEDLVQSEFDVFVASINDDYSGTRITFSSAENKIQGNVILAQIVFSIRYDGSYNEAPWTGETILTAVNGTSVDTLYNVYYKMNSIKLNYVEKTLIKGDVNFDGCINMTDLMQVQRKITHFEDIYGDEFTCADINNDGIINIVDCQYIQMYLVGKLGTLENIYSGNNNQDIYYVKLHNVIRENGSISSVNYLTDIEVENGDILANVIKRYMVSIDSCNYIGAFYDEELCNKIDLSLPVTDNMVIYLGYERSQTSTPSYNAKVSFVCNGIEITSSSLDIEIGANIYDTAKSLAVRYFNEYASFQGVYTDLELTMPISSDLVMEEKEEIQCFYVKMISTSVIGTYNVVEYVLDENGSMIRNEDGTYATTDLGCVVTFIDDTNGKYVDENGLAQEFTYINVAGQIICYVGDYTMLGFNLITFASDANNGALEIQMEFDGSDYKYSDEFATVAGTDYILTVSYSSDFSQTFIVELCDNGICKVNYNGIMAYCGYTVSGNNIVIDPDGETLGTMPVIIDVDKKILTVDTDATSGGVSGDVNVENVPTDSTTEAEDAAKKEEMDVVLG